MYVLYVLYYVWVIIYCLCAPARHDGRSDALLAVMLPAASFLVNDMCCDRYEIINATNKY